VGQARCCNLPALDGLDGPPTSLRRLEHWGILAPIIRWTDTAPGIANEGSLIRTSRSILCWQQLRWHATDSTPCRQHGFDAFQRRDHSTDFILTEEVVRPAFQLAQAVCLIGQVGLELPPFIQQLPNDVCADLFGAIGRQRHGVLATGLLD
jgi:hypothetical protein